MTKNRMMLLIGTLVVSVLVVTGASEAGDRDWRIYSEEANGDVYFYDASRVESASNVHTVWKRIRYKRSVMAASSYQSHLAVDCSERTTKILRRTFFSDKHWEERAMNTDMREKPKRSIPQGSAAERLLQILCDP